VLLQDVIKDCEDLLLIVMAVREREGGLDVAVKNTSVMSFPQACDLTGDVGLRSSFQRSMVEDLLQRRAHQFHHNERHALGFVHLMTCCCCGCAFSDAYGNTT